MNKTILIVVIILFLIVGGYFFWRSGYPSSKPSLIPTIETPTNTPSASEVEEITVIGKEFSFLPSEIAVKSGQKVKIIFENKGKNSHDLVIDDLGVRTKIVGAGQTDVVEFVASRSGTFDIICSVPGHKEAGMQGIFKVE